MRRCTPPGRRIGSALDKAIDLSNPAASFACRALFLAARDSLMRNDDSTPIISTGSAGQQPVIRVRVSFYSYFRELTGERGCVAELLPGTSVADAYALLAGRFPRLGPLRNSTLVAVGVEYQNKDYILQDGDELALFPPVQGG